MMRPFLGISSIYAVVLNFLGLAGPRVEASVSCESVGHSGQPTRQRPVDPQPLGNWEA